MEIQTIRKCKLCKENIVLEKNEFVPDGDKYYHYNCFFTFIENKKKNKLNQEEISKLAKELQKQYLNNTKDIINKNHLFKYLQKRYDLVYMPSFVFIKFNSVFDGTYKNLTEPVSAEDLLDMWIRKEGYLDKQYQWKLSKGESIDGVGKLYYDLAIILSKVSSYKKWKDTEEDKKNKIKTLSLENKINYNIISKSIENNKEQEENYIIEDEEEY